jgi:hypothetical protein
MKKGTFHTISLIDSFLKKTYNIHEYFVLSHSNYLVEEKN